ncbi:MAG: gamma carbonic anhydrase family protein [Acidobacteria bacterium]|nr:gamma carbonic anhydrase family protein [Acidobacteriota bacterium]
MLHPFGGHSPVVAATAFVARGASVIGDVVLGEDVSIWFSAVLRADVNFIRIGARSNLQDGVVVHVNAGAESTVVEDEVTVGHQAILHGCHLARRSLIGMGSVVLDGVAVGEEAMVAAGAVVPPSLKVPRRVLVRGVPGRVVRPLTDAEIGHLADSAARYVELKDQYLRERREASP